jgi:hypothetical protein
LFFSQGMTPMLYLIAEAIEDLNFYSAQWLVHSLAT